MVANSYGSQNQPHFSTTGGNDTAGDLSLIADYAALVGNTKIGTSAQMNALSGANLWTGLLFVATDVDLIYRYSGSSWDVVGGRFPVFSVRGSGSGQNTSGAWTVMTTGLGTPDVNRGFTSWTAATGTLLVKLPGIYEVQASVENAGIGTLGIQVALNTTADSNTAPLARQDDNTGASSTKNRTAGGSALITCAANDALRLLAVDTYSGAFLGGVIRDISFSVKFLGSA